MNFLLNIIESINMHPLNYEFLKVSYSYYYITFNLPGSKTEMFLGNGVNFFFR